MADVNKMSQDVHSCAVCGKTDHLKRCTRCRSAFYCNREHQLKDWDVHRRTCSKQPQNEKWNGNQERVLGDNGDRKVFGTDSKIGNSRPHQQSLDDATKESADENMSTKKNVDKNEEKSKGFDDSAAETENKATEPSVAEQPITRYNEQGEIEFDTRPLKLIDFPKPPGYRTSDIADFAAKCLTRDGYCVVDGILSPDQCEKIVKEVKYMDTSGLLKEGKLAGGKTSGVDSEKVVNKNIRSDKVAWLQGTETDRYPAVCQLITETMDDIVYGMRKHFGEQFLLNGRTKV